LDTEPDLFTGEVWLGERAKALGLIDGIDHLVPHLKARFGDKVKLRRYDVRRPLMARFGMRVMQDAIAQAEERAAFAQFGL
jgi:serine protease SohB